MVLFNMTTENDDDIDDQEVFAEEGDGGNDHAVITPRSWERSFIEWTFDDEHPTRRRRQGHLLSLIGQSVVIPEMGRIPLVHASYASFLAWKHLEERRGDILPDLPHLLSQCPELHWTYEARDTMFSPPLAVKHLLDATNLQKNHNATTTTSNHKNNTKMAPYALLGGYVGSVAGPLGIVGSALGIPLISGTAFAPEKEDTDVTTRTIMNVADGHGLTALQYMRYLGVSHMAFLYPDQDCCRPLASTFKKMEEDQGITVLPIPYDPLNITDALEVFRASEYRYVFVVVHMQSDFEAVMVTAYDQGVAGPDSNITWIHCERPAQLDPSYSLDRTSENADKLAAALHGSAVVNAHVDLDDSFVKALQQMQTNASLQQEFLAVQHDPAAFDEMGFNFSAHPVDAHAFFYNTFDAVIALGLAACHTPGLFTGTQLYETLLQLDFQGVSGRVAFDAQTRLRDFTTFQYQVYNLRVSKERSNDTHIRFEAPLAAKIQGLTVNSFLYNDSSNNNNNSGSFVFADNSTLLPPALTPLDPNEYDLNMIPVGVQIYGCLLAGLVMLVSVVLIAWTIRMRKLFVIRSAQPVFLVPICVGTFLMASATFPLSLQAKDEMEAQARHLDTACVLAPWLVYVGFVTTISALFSKTWRINVLTGTGRAMQRLRLMPHHVILPFVTLLALNVSVLTVWTVVDSYRYVRLPVEYDVDNFGRSLASYGACRSSEHKNLVYKFLVPLAALDIAMVLVATYECYKARHLPDDFAETKYLAVSMASFLESFIIGGPILLGTRNNPTAYFTVCASLLCVCCLGFLIPIFLPKYKNRGRKRQRRQSLMSFAVRSHREGMVRDSSNSRQKDFLNPSPVFNEPPQDTTAGSEYLLPGRMKIIRHPKQ